MASKKGNIPLLPFQLEFDTCCLLLDELLAQRQHARQAAEEGHPAMLESSMKLDPFINFLATHVDRYS